jgi:hypothetical protein
VAWKLQSHSTYFDIAGLRKRQVAVVYMMAFWFGRVFIGHAYGIFLGVFGMRCVPWVETQGLILLLCRRADMATRRFFPYVGIKVTGYCLAFGNGIM